MNGALPVLLLMGAPGSGKTTLLSRWLVDPEFAEAAVLVNELGDVPVDRHFVSGFTGAARAIPGGCLCCTMRAGLAATLDELYRDRFHRRIPRFTRLVIEVAGMADPAPIIEELASNPAIREIFRLEGVIAVLDASVGASALDAYPELVAQVAAADALVVTKIDLAPSHDIDYLEARLNKLNPRAGIVRSMDGNAHPQLVVAAMSAAARDARPRAAAPATPARAHTAGIRAMTLRPAGAFDPEALRSRLEAFLERHGGRVLRMKGLVPIIGRPGPAVVHAVGGVLYPVRLRMRWPEGASSAVVVVTQGLEEEVVAAALDESPATG